MLLSRALLTCGLAPAAVAGVVDRLIPQWGGARLYISGRSAERDRRGALAPHGASEQFLSDLRRAIRAFPDAGPDPDRVHAGVVLYLRGYRVDVDSDFWAKPDARQRLLSPHGKP